MINYTLFNDRASKRVFGLELLNVVNSGLNFVKSGLSISNIGGLSYSVSSGEFYLGGESYSFGGDSIVLTGAGSGKFKLVALLVDSSGVLSKSDGVVVSSLGSVKCPSVNPLTHFCVGIVLLNDEVGAIFNTSIVNDYFSDVYLDDSIDDVVDKNAEDIFDLQTVFKGVSSFIPVSNPWVFSDWFTDTTGKLNLVNTAACTAVFDTNKYKLTFGSTTLLQAIDIGTYATPFSEGLIDSHDFVTPVYINDVRVKCSATCSSDFGSDCNGHVEIKMIYEDNSFFVGVGVSVHAWYGGDTESFNHLNQIVLDYSKKVRRIEVHGKLEGTGLYSFWAHTRFEFTSINNEINYVTLSGLSEDATVTKLIANINTTDAIPCPTGGGYSATNDFVGAYMNYDYFKYDLYDEFDNVQSGLSLGVENDITGLSGKPVKMVIKIIPPTLTTFYSNSVALDIDSIPLIKTITGYPYINDFCLITYKEVV